MYLKRIYNTQTYLNMELNDNDQANETPNEGKKPVTFLPKLEVIIIGVFFLSFSLWAISKCSNTRNKYEQMAIEAQKEDSLLNILNTPPPAPKEKEPEKQETTTIQEKITPLYVILENLNVRDKPSLKGKIVARLKLFDEVAYLNEVTDFKEEVELGNIITNEPWVKVRTNDGTEGWVYGAGVKYYKTKLQIENPQFDVN